MRSRSTHDDFQVMAHPLELAYQWRLPVLFSTVGLSVCIGTVARQRPVGWISVLVLMVVLWAGFLALVWLRTQAYLLVDGPQLELRSRRGYAHVAAADVQAVQQLATPHGPSYRLTVRAADRSTRRVTVPTALLRDGQATLFSWLSTWASQATLDAKSQQTLHDLRTRGQLR